MKVLSASDLKWSGKVSCSCCNAQLEVDLSDLKRVSGWDQRDQSSWDYAVFYCPICNSKTASADLLRSVPVYLRDKLGPEE